MLESVMEVLIAASTAALGWILSKKYPAKDTTGTIDLGVRPESFPFQNSAGDSVALKKEYEARSEARFNEALSPKTTGVIPRYVQPYFKSYGKQNTNEAVSQRRMEMYTGNNDLATSATQTWKPKRETEGTFNPRQHVTSGGTQGNPDQYTGSRHADVSGIQNNTLPFAQKRVGPGIGVPSSVTATDGFHSQFRVMPIDAHGYKHNALVAPTNHGASRVAHRSTDPEHYSKGVPRFYDMDRRPMEKSRASTTGQAIRPDHTIKGNKYDSREERYGPARGDGGVVQSSQWTRDRPDDIQVPGMLNPKGPRAPTAPDSFDTNKFDGKRDSRTDYTGIIGSRVPVGTSRDDRVRETIRESHGEAFDRNTGILGSAVKAPRIQCTDKQLLKASKRGDYSMNSYVAGPQNNDALRLAQGKETLHFSKCQGSMALKSDDNQSRMLTHGQSSQMYENRAAAGNHSRGGRNKLESENRFQDYGIAKAVLKNNDLALNFV